MKQQFDRGAYVLAILLAAACSGYSADAHARSVIFSHKELPASIVRSEVQSDVMDFADRFSARIEQAASELAKQVDIYENRLIAARFRVGAVASAIDIATGPYPGVALLDMMVFVTLNRMVWEEYWHPRRFSGKADVILDTLKTLEKQIWSVGARVLTAEQQAELRELIEEWREKNPNQWDVNFIRFSSFGSLGHKPALHLAIQAGGLLGPVQEAANAAQEVREVAERAMYLLSRMQLLAGFQVDWMFQELIQQPEMKQILSDTNRLRAMSEDLSRLLEQMPVQIEGRANKIIDNLAKQVTAERKATIDHLMNEVAKERASIFAELDARNENVQGLLSRVGQLVADGSVLTSQAKETVASLDRLATRLESPSVSAENIRALTLGAHETLRELNTSVESIDRLLSSQAWEKRTPELISLINRTEASTKGLLNHIFMLIAGLVLFFFIVKFGYGLTSKKVFGPKKASPQETEVQKDISWPLKA